jgi:hypothetical protein
MYLFANIFSKEKYESMLKRSLAICFHAWRTGTNGHIYDEMMEYAKFWSFEKLLERNEKPLDTVTRLFYANMRSSEPSNESEIKTFLFGQEIILTPEILADWFGLSNNPDHELFYLEHGESLAKNDVLERAIKSKDPRYFVTNWVPMQRIVFHLINNILIPVIKGKTNLERRSAYLLRHLWYKSKTFNVPNFILHHMRYSWSKAKMSLPYGNLILFICEKLKIEIPPIFKRQAGKNLDLLNPKLLTRYHYAKLGGIYRPIKCAYFEFPTLNEDGKPNWPRSERTYDFDSIAMTGLPEEGEEEEEEIMDDMDEDDPEFDPENEALNETVPDTPSDIFEFDPTFSSGNFEQASRSYYAASYARQEEMLRKSSQALEISQNALNIALQNQSRIEGLYSLVQQNQNQINSLVNQFGAFADTYYTYNPRQDPAHISFSDLLNNLVTEDLPPDPTA